MTIDAVINAVSIQRGMKLHEKTSRLFKSCVGIKACARICRSCAAPSFGECDYKITDYPPTPAWISKTFNL